MPFQKVFIFIFLWFVILLYIYLLVLHKYLELNMCLTLQMDPDVSVCCGCCRKNLWLILFGVLTSVFPLNYNSICHYVCVRSCWSSNPHFRGTYSYRSVASETLGAFASHLAEPVTNDSKKPVCIILYAVSLMRDTLEYCQMMNRNCRKNGNALVCMTVQAAVL